MFFLLERYFALVWLLNDENMQYSMLDLICGRATASKEESSATASDGTKKGVTAPAPESTRAGGNRVAPVRRPQPRKTSSSLTGGRRRSTLSLRRRSFSPLSSSSVSDVDIAASAPTHRNTTSHQGAGQRGRERRFSAAAAALAAPSVGARATSKHQTPTPKSVSAELLLEEDTQRLQFDKEERVVLQQQQQQQQTRSVVVAGAEKAEQPLFETVGVHAATRRSVTSIAEVFTPLLPASLNAVVVSGVDATTTTTAAVNINVAVCNGDGAQRGEVDRFTTTTQRGTGAYAERNVRTSTGMNVADIYEHYRLYRCDTDSVFDSGSISRNAALRSDSEYRPARLRSRRRHSIAGCILRGDASLASLYSAEAGMRAYSSSGSARGVASLAEECFIDKSLAVAQDRRQQDADVRKYSEKEQRQQQIHDQQQHKKGQHHKEHHHHHQQRQHLFRVSKNKVVRRPLAVIHGNTTCGNSGSTRTGFDAKDTLWGPSSSRICEGEQQRPQRELHLQQQERKGARDHEQHVQQLCLTQQQQEEQVQRRRAEHQWRQKQRDSASFRHQEAAQSTVETCPVLPPQMLQQQQYHLKKPPTTRRRRSSVETAFPPLNTAVRVAAAK